MVTSAAFEDALLLATEAHRGQLEKNGQPYILHALRVAMRMETDETRCAAVLHDVVEDTRITLEDLHARGFTVAVVCAVDALTRRAGETYEEFVARAARDPIARVVKLADLEDNMDVRRLPEIAPDVTDRLDRYLRAWRYLRRLDAAEYVDSPAGSHDA